MRHRARHRLQDAQLRRRRQLGRPPRPDPGLARQLRQPGQRRRAPQAAELVGRQIRRRDLDGRHPLPGHGVDRPVRPERAPVAHEPHLPGPLAPFRNQVGEAHVLLALPRAERRLLRVLRVVGEIVFLQIRQDLRPPARERVHERLIVARELEPRHPSDHPRRHRHAERLHALREFVPVIRPDQLLAALDRRRLDAPPFARGVPRHVGQHAMGVELGVPDAAGQVAEPRHRHAMRRHPRALPGHRVEAPGLQQIRLDPVQRCPHRIVMRPDHPPVAHHQRLERHRLGRRQGDVQPRAVVVLALAHPPEPDLRPRNPARQHILELPGQHMPLQPELLRRLPVPEARVAVLRVVLRVVPVLLEYDTAAAEDLSARTVATIGPSQQTGLARGGGLRRARRVRLSGIRRRALTPRCPVPP